MAELSVADSSAGPLMICMRAGFLPAGRCWEAVWTEKIRMLTETAITNRGSLLMCRPHGCFTLQKMHRRRGATSKCHLSSGSFHLLAKWTNRRRKSANRYGQLPVNVLESGYGVVKPSVSVFRKATIWSSSVAVKPSLPIVMSFVCGTSGTGQQFTFSLVPAGQFPDVTSKGY